MTEDKIFADPSEAAKIVFNDRRPSIVAPTLQEAVIAFGHLAAERREKAVIETAGGKKFGPEEIERLHKAG